MTDFRPQSVIGIVDPESPGHVLKPQADGSILVSGFSGNITGNITVNDVAHATAADPTLIEGADTEISVNLTGYQRVKLKGTITNVNVGQGAMSASIPVVIASDQSPVPISGNLTTVSTVTGVTTVSTVTLVSTVTTVGAVTAITNPLPAGTNVIGHVIVDSGAMTVGNAASSAVNVQTSFLFSNITTATTTTVKSGAGILRGVTINTKGTIASAVTIYDSLSGSGTKIGTIDSLNLAGQFEYDIAFSTGLTIVTTGTVAPDITVAYR